MLRHMKCKCDICAVLYVLEKRHGNGLGGVITGDALMTLANVQHRILMDLDEDKRTEALNFKQDIDMQIFHAVQPAWAALAGQKAKQ
jgi:hypothetical protein